MFDAIMYTSCNISYSIDIELIAHTNNVQNGLGCKRCAPPFSPLLPSVRMAECCHRHGHHGLGRDQEG